jgi:hypothetical protein
MQVLCFSNVFATITVTYCFSASCAMTGGRLTEKGMVYMNEVPRGEVPGR